MKFLIDANDKWIICEYQSFFTPFYSRFQGLRRTLKGVILNLPRGLSNQYHLLLSFAGTLLVSCQKPRKDLTCNRAKTLPATPQRPCRQRCQAAHAPRRPVHHHRRLMHHPETTSKKSPSKIGLLHNEKWAKMAPEITTEKIRFHPYLFLKLPLKSVFSSLKMSIFNKTQP